MWLSSGVTQSDVPSGKTQGFASYTRVDNETFGGVVDRLHKDLCGTYEAMTGKQILLFLDRESIGWGEDWRQKIHESVESATVFIPIVTMRYFNSQMCMEELLTFHAAAKRLGVTELILPIVLFGAEQIRDDDPRPEVQLIARLNYRNIEAAWTAGYDSAEWRTFVADRARDLDRALQRAESVLASEEKSAAARVTVTAATGQSSGTATLSKAEEDLPTFDLEDMTDRMSLVEPLTTRAVSELEFIGSLIGEFSTEGITSQAAKVRAIRLADQLSEPATRIEQTGSELEEVMFGLDSEVRALVSELSSIDLPEARKQLIDLLTSFQSVDMEDVGSQIQQAIEMIRLVTIGNMTMRRALGPATRGFRSMKNAVGVFSGWQALLDELRAGGA